MKTLNVKLPIGGKLEATKSTNDEWRLYIGKRDQVTATLAAYREEVAAHVEFLERLEKKQ
jgi:hypothetical protein